MVIEALIRIHIGGGAALIFYLWTLSLSEKGWIYRVVSGPGEWGRPAAEIHI